VSGRATGALSATAAFEHIGSRLIVVLQRLVVVLPATSAVVMEASRRRLVLDLLLAGPK
jgi:hypothetical protein